MTLLSRKEGTSTSDFRAYWSGCHAQLALCMDGITSYTQNRVDKTLWSKSDVNGCFNVDGVVELCFESDDVMSVAQASAVGSRYIPEDEPNFLRGWSLCVVEHDLEQERPGVKVIVIAALDNQLARADFVDAIATANRTNAPSTGRSFNWTVRTAKRERLWSEPVSPDVLISFWFDDVAQAHAAFEATSPLARALSQAATRAAAYLINSLVIK
ncbi:EthD domain-containing protein [Caballeronia calidae]|nr:EthD domain-containing protein [Caballeronia calidae]